MIALSGCGLREDSTYLTPIPEATIYAYHEDLPIENKLQAVIAAQAELGTTRFDFEDLPAVRSVEELKLEKAQQKIKNYSLSDTQYDERPDNTKVWLILFDGQMRLIPLFSDETPGPYSRWCVYVMIDENGRSELGTFPCPE